MADPACFALITSGYSPNVRCHHPRFFGTLSSEEASLAFAASGAASTGGEAAISVGAASSDGASGAASVSGASFVATASAFASSASAFFLRGARLRLGFSAGASSAGASSAGYYA